MRQATESERRIPFQRTRDFERRTLLGMTIAGALATSLAIAIPAEARTTRLEILSRGPAFGGHAFAGVGAYEKITGIAHGEIDPKDPLNAVITDIELAPVNGRGNVEYQHNFYILKPLDLGKGAHKVMYEPPNRGGKTFATLNRSPAGGALTNDPGAITDPNILDNSFLWPRGYTMVFSGWENDLGPLTGLTATAHFPIAKNTDGSTITGPAYEYIVTSGTSFTLTYPAASLNKADAVLTHRVHLDDIASVVPESAWDYNADGTAIHLNPANTRFIANDIYEFSYKAKDPTPNGMGMAVVRDFNSFLRHAAVDDVGTANPLAGDITRIYTEISSQPGRFLNDFVHLGFNEDEGHRKVFDGMMQWVAAADGLNMNYRWSDTSRTNRNRQDLLYLEGLFPFANVTTFDPISGETDGRNKKCAANDTCPLKMEFYSSNEYWVKAASLFHTDTKGTVDLPDDAYSRLYLLSSKQHGGAGNPASFGNCQQRLNPLDSAQVQRALWIALDDWSTKGIEPPPSQVPRLADGTLVPVPDPALTGGHYVGIPFVTYTGLKTTRYRFNYGPDFYSTYVPTINPPIPAGFNGVYEDNPQLGPIYTSYVPKWDSDGNEIAGIRLPELEAPLATYTGWALRSGTWANDGCEGSGQYIPFAKTKDEREATGDPRPSVAERYKAFGQYRSGVVNAVDELVKNRFFLCEDTSAAVKRLIDAGLVAGVPAPKGTEPMYPAIPHCN